MHDKKYILAYLLQGGYTHHDIKNILFDEWLSIEQVWSDSKNGKNPLELSDDRISRIREKISKVDEESIRNLLDSKNIEIIDWQNPHYPESLKQIGHAPAFFYLRGALRESLPPLLGVVWSRKHTPYATRILEKILPDIIHHGVWVVSGGAAWVDTLGHRLTVDYGGYTIAVFGTGIDRCYPAQNKKLFEDIIASGWALISHFPLGTGPELYNFPIRNEIVAGLSHGILIPEAGLSSGTLITAQLALEHGREVFAVPGDIDRSTSEGTNMLISTGQGKCVRNSGDVLEEYFDVKSLEAGMTPVVRVAPILDSDEKRSIYSAIESGSHTVDTLLNSTGYDMTTLLTDIAMLEIDGHIRMDEMGRYQIV